MIESVDADIVGVLESYNRLPEMAENTGYPYCNVSLQILSRFPIHEPSEAEGRYAWIEVAPGTVVALFHIHLDYVRYGPKLLGTALRSRRSSRRRTRLALLRNRGDTSSGSRRRTSPVGGRRGGLAAAPSSIPFDPDRYVSGHPRSFAVESFASADAIVSGPGSAPTASR